MTLGRRVGLFSSIKSGFKKIVNGIRSGISQIFDLAKEAANRVFGVVDFVASLVGIMLPKKLRLKVLILLDETGLQIATESEAQPVIDRAIDIFRAELNTKIIASGGRMIDIVAEIPPTEVLEPDCGFDAWTDELGDPGYFYFKHATTNAASFFTGYASPVTAFIVRNVRGEKGCSLGPLTNYLTLDRSALPTINVGSPGDDVSASIG